MIAPFCLVLSLDVIDFFNVLVMFLLLGIGLRAADDSERSNATADFIHVVAFFFLCTVIDDASVSALVLLESVSSVIDGLIFVRHLIISLV